MNTATNQDLVGQITFLVYSILKCKKLNESILKFDIYGPLRQFPFFPKVPFFFFFK